MTQAPIKTNLMAVANVQGWDDRNKAAGDGEHWQGRNFQKVIDGVTYNVGVSYTDPAYGSTKPAQIKDATFQYKREGGGYGFFRLPWREQYGNELLSVFSKSVVEMTKRQKVEALLAAPGVVAWLIAEHKNAEREAQLAREAKWAADRKQRRQPVQISGNAKVFTENANRAWDLARAIYNFDGLTEPTEIENKVKQLAEAVAEIQAESLGYQHLKAV